MLDRIYDCVPSVFKVDAAFVEKQLKSNETYWTKDDISKWAFGPIAGGFFLYETEEDARDALRSVLGD